jgi:hypothetical protein
LIEILELDRPTPVWTATGCELPVCFGATTLIKVSLTGVYWAGDKGVPPISTLETSDGYKMAMGRVEIANE